VEIILINGTYNKNLKKNSVGLIVSSGSMSDDKILGLAHFTEHMLFLGSKKYPNVTFFNDFITSNEGHFNGFTDKDTTAFFYEINREKFEESLDIFLNFFVRPLFKPEYIEKEIFAVNSEYEKNIHSEEKRFDRMFQSLANPYHPFNKFSTGNKQTIKGDFKNDAEKSDLIKYELNTKNIKLINQEKALRENVIKYFHKNYIGRNIKLILNSNFELENIKKILVNNLIKIRNPKYHAMIEKQEKLPDTSEKTKTLNQAFLRPNLSTAIFSEKEKSKIIYYKSRYKTLKVFFILDDFKDLNQTGENLNPKAYFKTVFSMREKYSLHEILIKHRFIFNYKVDFKNKYRGLYAIYFDFLLTQRGLRNIDAIIKILSQYISIVHKNVKNKEVFDIIARVENKKFYSRPEIKNPYKELKKWLKNFYLYSRKNFIKSDNLLNNFKPEILHKFVEQMKIRNMLAFVGSRTFKNVNETFLYHVLNYNHNLQQLRKFNHSQFLDKKEKWYKTKYKEYKITEDQVIHLNKRKLNNTHMEFPFRNKKEISNLNKDKNKTNSSNDSLCGKGKKKSDCEDFYKMDKKILAPSLIFISNIKFNNISSQTFNSLSNKGIEIINNRSNSEIFGNYYSEIYHKLDRTHFKKSFILNLKVIPFNDAFELKDPKTVPLIKFLVMYLNFKYSQLLLDSNFMKNPQNENISVEFLDNLRLKSNLFNWRKSKEKLLFENFMIDGIYLRIKAKSEETYEQSDVYSIIENVLSSKIERMDYLYLKEELLRQIEFYRSTNPSHQALSWLFRLGFKYDIDYFDMNKTIKKLKLPEINEFREKIFRNLKFVSLAVGTITEEKAKDYIQKLEKLFIKEEEKFYNKILSLAASNDIKSSTTNSSLNQDSSNLMNFTLSQIKKRQRFMQAPFTKYGSLFIFQKNNLFKHSPDSTTLNTYFLGEKNIRNTANIKIISNIAGNIFFSYLRIKHQLGYSIKHKLTSINHNLIFYIHVQGSKKHPSSINHYIDKSFYKIKKKLNNIDDYTFYKVKDIVYSQITKLSTNLDKKNLFYWGYIQGEENIFNKEKLRAYLNHLSISDLIKFIDSMLENKLSIQVANQSAKYEKIDKESIYIGDVEYFRKFANFKRPDINEKEYEDIVVKPDFNPDLIEAFKTVNKYES